MLELAAKAIQIIKKVHELRKFVNNPKQVLKLWRDIKAIGKDFKGKEPIFCIDETTVDVVEHVKVLTKWSGKVIKKAKEARFDPIEEYRWAEEEAQQGQYEDGPKKSKSELNGAQTM